MNDERLTDELASRIMGWKPTPDRFIKSGRTWPPRVAISTNEKAPGCGQFLEKAAPQSFTGFQPVEGQIT